MADDKRTKKFQPILLGKVNFIIAGISILLLIIGYVLMSGGNSPDGVSFNPEVFSFTRIKLAPLFVTLGYIGILLAIVIKGKRD